MTNALDFLGRRLSVPARQLGEPAPSPAQLDALFAAALRVPDHGKLAPYRLLLIRGGAVARFGEALADLHRRIDPGAPEAAFDKDRARYATAPLVVVVVARLQRHPKVPEQDQLLSAGCVAYNLLLGAQALGYGAQWLTGWAAHDREAAGLLGLTDGERVTGFVPIGSVRKPAADTPRPQVADCVAEWHPPDAAARAR